MLRLELVDVGVTVHAATLGPTLLVGLLSAWIAPRLSVPRITVSVPAVVIMVPAVAVYRAVVTSTTATPLPPSSPARRRPSSSSSIAVGLAAARMLTYRDWAYDR